MVTYLINTRRRLKRFLEQTMFLASEYILGLHIIIKLRSTVSSLELGSVGLAAVNNPT